jgi:hypothetical protein
MKKASVRVTIEIPISLYRRLKKRAAEQRRSIGELVSAGARSILFRSRRPRSHKVRFPLIVSTGPKVRLTNEQIYERIGFP